ncbi:MAG TPA: nucleotidyltransferase family protein [Terriglobales bacterium]|nr:nucleotidyltransferase family protein [Terriglobales bacterium]
MLERRAAHFRCDANFSPEFPFLLNCCAMTVATGDRELGIPEIDWEALAQMAERHNVTPLVYHALASHKQYVPVEVFARLQLNYVQNWHKNLRLSAELIRVMDCLSASGVCAVPYKGAVLAQELYGDLALRQFSDLDILVRPQDLPTAQAAVLEIGYTPSLRMSEAEGRAHLRSGYERAFDGPLGRNLLELQWRTAPRFYAIEMNVEGLLQRCEYTEVSGSKVRTLHPADLFLVLCVHAAKHGWERLNWVCDIAMLMTRPGIDYSGVCARARELGIERMVGITSRLARELLGVNLPEELARLTERDGNTEEIAKERMAAMASSVDMDIESLAYFRLMIDARERTRDKTRFVLRLACTPGSGEWSALKLPTAMFPLYRLVRFGRLTKRLFGGRVRSGAAR